MSLAAYLSKPSPVFSKLAGVLGNLRAVQFVVAKVSALLGRNKARIGQPLVSEFTGEDSGVTGSTENEIASVPVQSNTDAVSEPAKDARAHTRCVVDADAAALKPQGSGTPTEPRTIVEPSGAIATPETDDRFAREKLIRRRWAETGSKLWNPDFHGGENATLNIQGGIALLPPKPGGTLPRYDTLEFRTRRSRVDGHEVIRVVCEGVAIDPPGRRSRDGVRRAQ